MGAATGSAHPLPPTGNAYAALAILAGAALLLWPAFLNGYPLVFSDTGAILEMSLEPTMGWDKPWVYAPFMHLFHWRWTLWMPVLAQGVILSHLLWLLQRARGRHVLLCAALALGSAAPWFTSTLMPDFFTPITPLCLVLLAWGGLTRAEAVYVAVLGAVAMASHLAHLPLAAACIATIALMQWRAALRAALPLAGALGLLLATNFVGYGRLAVSPHGSVFALARLIGDGPGRAYIDAACPTAGLQLCAWSGRLAHDSDEFLWHPYGPLWDRALWGDRFGPVALAPEASFLVPAIVGSYPAEVLQAAIGNTMRQLTLLQVGDTLVADHLDTAVLPKLRHYFPVAEAERFMVGRQAQGRMADAAGWLQPLHLLLLGAGALGCALLILRWRQEPALARFALVVLVALAANAFATGALSKPHHRYGARIAWLVLLPPLLYAARRDTSSGLLRTNAS